MDLSDSDMGPKKIVTYGTWPFLKFDRGQGDRDVSEVY